MSKTSKIRKARIARDRAIETADYERRRREALELKIAKAQFNFKMLADVVGQFGETNLFYALVHGVHPSGVKTISPVHKVKQVHELDIRRRESMADMACLGHVNHATLHALEVFMQEKHREVGHILSLQYRGKDTIAFDLDALKYMPERMIARELSEIFAEELKGTRNV